ncbi:hypothetical protein [Pararhizobium qamdonense]|uniref:hypothetical protein n=1 Tax=Pararhizobium qamdonense TaxID=3031126 RepID=UPI0023E30D00|nr:hypothetical protein [Pararhizobium qamdonense]
MTDIISSDWAELDASNSNPSPNGVQGGYAPSTIAPTIRAIRGAVKRAYVQGNALVTTTGNGSAYLLTYGAAPESYAKGVVIRFYAHTDNTGACSLNINSLGPKSILSQHGVALTAGQIKAGQLIEVAYNGTSFQIISNEIHDAKFTGNTTFAALSGNGSSITGLNGSNISTGTVPDVRLPTFMGGKTFTSPVTVRGGSDGYSVVATGEANRSGYLAFHLANANRVGYIGYADANTKVILLSTESGATFNFSGLGNDPTVNNNKIWHAGNGGAGSGLAADTTDGYHASEAKSNSTLVARSSTGQISAQDANLSRDATTGYLFFGSNGTNNIGSDGTYIRTVGLPFRVNGNASATGQLDVTGNITGYSGGIHNQAANASSNSVYWWKNSSGTPRAAHYFGPEERLITNLYDSSGTLVRSAGYRVSDGEFWVQGFIKTDGNVLGNGIFSTGAVGAGDARMQVDGNVTFKLGMEAAHGASLYDALNARVKNDGGTWNINITGNSQALNNQNAAYYTNIPARLGYTPFNRAGDQFQGSISWNTSTGEKTFTTTGGVYLYGNTDSTGWYDGNSGGGTVWNYNKTTKILNLASQVTSNGSALVTNNGGTWSLNITGSAGNSNALGGDGPSSFAKIHTGNTTTETNYPLGHIIFVSMVNRPDLNTFNTIRISGTTAYTNDSSGTALAGTWRHRGGYTVSGDRFGIFQRVS